MEHKFEIRLPGSTFHTHKKWTGDVECFFFLFLSSPTTFLKDGAKIDRWTIRKKIYNFPSEDFKRKFGRSELEGGWWRHTFNQSIFLIPGFLWLVARVKFWLSSEVQYCAHSRSSIRSPLNLLQNVLYIKLSQGPNYWNLGQFYNYNIFKMCSRVKSSMREYTFVFVISLNICVFHKTGLSDLFHLQICLLKHGRASEQVVSD